MAAEFRQWLRYILAIVVSPFVAEIIGFPFAIALDVAWGQDITAGVWAFTIPNIILVIIKASLLGLVAGWISGAHGKLVAAIANFFPLIAVLIISIALNRDFLGSVPTATKPALWTWLGVIPALIAGGYAVKHARNSVGPIFVLIGSSMGFVVPFGAVAFHVYTVITAYQLSGFGSAIIAFIFPILSELWYSWKIWGIAETFWNVYTLRFVLLVGWSIAAFVVLAIGNYLQERANFATNNVD